MVMGFAIVCTPPHQQVSTIYIWSFYSPITADLYYFVYLCSQSGDTIVKKELGDMFDGRPKRTEYYDLQR